MSSPATAPQVQTEEPEKLPVTILHVERLIRRCVTLVLICYSLGLIVINLHLYAIGVSDFSLLKAKAVFTGFWTLVAYLSCSSLPATIEVLKKQYRDFHPKRDFCFYCLGSQIFFISICLVIPLILHSLLFGFGPFLRSSEYFQDLRANWLSLLLTFLFATVSGVGIVELLKSLSGSKRHFEIIASMSSTLHAEVGIPLLFGALFVGSFTFFIYPKIPDGLGGGGARAVRLILKPELSKQAEMLHIPLVNENYTQPVYLIYEGEDFVVIATHDRTIRLDKKLIDGFLPRPAPFLEDEVKAWDEENSVPNNFNGSGNTTSERGTPSNPATVTPSLDPNDPKVIHRPRRRQPPHS